MERDIINQARVLTSSLDSEYVQHKPERQRISYKHVYSPNIIQEKERERVLAFLYQVQGAAQSQLFSVNQETACMSSRYHHQDLPQNCKRSTKSNGS